MKNKILAVILTLALATASGCSIKTEEVKTLTPQSLIETVNKENEAFIKRDTTYDEADIYIADDDAQEAVLRCIEYYSGTPDSL